MNGRTEVPYASWQTGDYATYFACKLIDAHPGTDEHLVNFRNYVFCIGAVACESLGRHEEVTDQIMNDLFSQNIRSAATTRNTQVPEIASMSLNTNEWRKHWRWMLEDLHVPGKCPSTPLDFLSALVSGEITYKSIMTQ